MSGAVGHRQLVKDGLFWAAEVSVTYVDNTYIRGRVSTVLTDFSAASARVDEILQRFLDEGETGVGLVWTECSTLQ